MDSKIFGEVFPNIKLNKELLTAFEDVLIDRVGMTPDRKEMRICITSDHIIEKWVIRKMEKLIGDVVVKDKDVRVRILQRYHLSDSYNLKTLMDAYGDSISDELMDYDHLLSSAYRHGRIEFTDDNSMRVFLPDTLLNRDGKEKLLTFLYKVIRDRCGIEADITVDFDEDLIVSHTHEEEVKMKRRIAEIAARAGMETVYSTEDAPGEDAAWGSSEGSPKAPSMPGSSNAKSFNGKKSDSKMPVGANRKPLKQASDNPNLIFGREFEGDVTPIVDIIGEIGEVIIRGQVISTEERPIRNEKTIYFFDVTDFTDTMHMKVFVHNEDLAEIRGKIKKGAFIKVRGMALTDSFSKSHDLTIDRISGVMSISDFRTTRSDLSEKKRVELHCHTKMSDMDGVSDVKDIVKRAYKWGHPAIAITDHGVAQAFPDANHAWEDIGDPNFKIIYGLEAYIVDDLAKVSYYGKGQSLDNRFVVFDLETTGFSCVKNKIIEIGAVKLEGGKIVDRFSTFVNPLEPIPHRITKLTSIDDDMVRTARTIEEILPEFLEFVGDSVLVAHNASFDTSFIRHNCEVQGFDYDYSHVDTVELSRILLPHLPNYKLDTVAKDLNCVLDHHHRAVDDAECTALIFEKEIEILRSKGIRNIDELNALDGDRVAKVKKMRSHHAVILAKNNTGRVNLYKLISESHLNYFVKKGAIGTPCIPKSLLDENREGLLLGSACEAGELYEALVEDRPDEEIAAIVEYYDYLEIQPVGNNMFMIASDKHSGVNSVEDIQDLNRRVVALGDRFMKPVVATCDVHFLDPEDEIYRRVIQTSKGFKDADNQAPLFLRTTDEMLKEFMYLGPDKAEEVVITNTVKIADMIDTIKPVRPDKCPPVIADSDKTLTEICYSKAHEIYGDPLPDIVEERLKRELNSIISNGFAVMYIIAQKLVWKSVEDGYLVGSRGSVGSSFVATMAGITEVNPLSPHYYCKKCHYVDFYSDEVKAYAGKAGIDMPEKNCPVCGEKLFKDGFDIPFETFLGFKGDKEPDIDLNFSNEYQSKAHKYTEVIFGAGQTFKAGTIQGVADKTAFGIVKKYYEEHGVAKRGCEINRLALGCMGVRSSTGQHPGGIVVLPVGEDINSFTPVQHPANDVTTDIVTTHFDYHSIDHNLLKLDILGHLDPTMIRMLQDLTGVDPITIPLDDPGVMSLFRSTEALGITPEDIGGVPLGCLGVPEFGTNFAMGMLLDTKPQAFSDLVRIAGLAHGTDVWQGNAEKLIKEGTATISTAICTRDDIMLYLIQMGVESSRAFSIMENVRKGKVAKGKCKEWPEWKEDMLAHNVPEWYTWSCEHIQYMFPKAHAAAYVMMAWRVAYCKVYYPLQFYASFFTIRADAFNYATMCFGPEALKNNMKAVQDEIKRKKDLKQTTNTEEKTIRDMQIVLEMYARGFEFMPIDLKLVKARHFQVIDGKIMPSLTSIEGLGDKAAELIVDGCKGDDFLSKEDFRNRTKASQTISDIMADLGILGDIPETNQLSIFDFANM